MKRWILLALLFGFTSSAQAQFLQEIDWMSEHYPPFNYREDGIAKGIATDVLLEIFRRMDFKKDPKEIRFYPWARSYRVLQQEPGTALYSMTFTEERSKMFRFVKPILFSTIDILAKKDRKLQIQSVEDMNQLKIGVIRDDVGEQLIRSLGVKDGSIEASNFAKNMVQKLDLGRLDAIAYGEVNAKWNMRLVGIDPTQYESVYVLKKAEMSFAFHKDTDPDLLQQLQKELDALHAEGFVEVAMKKYLE